MIGYHFWPGGIPVEAVQGVQVGAKEGQSLNFENNLQMVVGFYNNPQLAV